MMRALRVALGILWSGSATGRIGVLLAAGLLAGAAPAGSAGAGLLGAVLVIGFLIVIFGVVGGGHGWRS